MAPRFGSSSTYTALGERVEALGSDNGRAGGDESERSLHCEVWLMIDSVEVE